MVLCGIFDIGPKQILSVPGLRWPGCGYATDSYRTFKMKKQENNTKNIIRYVPLEYTKSIGRHWIRVKIVALK